MLQVMCLQETKLQDSHVAQAIQDLGMGGWAAAFNCSQAKKGYSGTAIFCRCGAMRRHAARACTWAAVRVFFGGGNEERAQIHKGVEQRWLNR